jgi:cbb3-type cytochrome oxidase maturation protein
MEVIFLLIGISLAMAVTFLWLFYIAMKGGQFEDEYTPAIRILFEKKDKQNNIKQN